jgi:hypothetical protein
VLLPAPIDQALASQLNAAAGLQPLTKASAYDLWQVSGPAARVLVVTRGGTVVPVPSGPVGVNAVIPPDTSGTLELAEAAGGWSATLDGKPLTRLAAPVHGWAQGFALPAGGGRLVITRNETARNLSLAGEAVALLAVLVLALPGSRSVPVPAEAAADAATLPAGRRRARAAGAREQSAAGAREPRAAGAREQSAAGEREQSVRRQPALAGVPAGGGVRPEGDDVRPGSEAVTGAGADPFGTHDDDEYGAAAGYGADASYGADPGYDEDPAPWAGLPPATPATPGTPAAPAAPRPAEAARPPDPAPAAPRRGRGAHAARHGKPSRRGRGSSSERGDS